MTRIPAAQRRFFSLDAEPEEPPETNSLPPPSPRGSSSRAGALVPVILIIGRTIKKKRHQPSSSTAELKSRSFIMPAPLMDLEDLCPALRSCPKVSPGGNGIAANLNRKREEPSIFDLQPMGTPLRSPSPFGPLSAAPPPCYLLSAIAPCQTLAAGNREMGLLEPSGFCCLAPEK